MFEILNGPHRGYGCDNRKVMEKYYAKIQHAYKIQYSPELLWKYHDISKDLAFGDDNVDNPVLNSPNTSALFKELIISDSEKRRSTEIQEEEVTSTFYLVADEPLTNDNYTIVAAVDHSKSLTQQEKLHFDTLLYITKKYVDNDLRMFFIRDEDDDPEQSDEEFHRQNLAQATFAYEYLRDLRNLLAMREEGVENSGIVFDIYDLDENQKKKKRPNYQVKVFDDHEKKLLIDLQINNIISSIVGFSGHEYLPSLQFVGKHADNIDLAFVQPFFENLRPLIETEKKQSSARRVFKGLLLKVIEDYTRNENFTFGQTEMDERMEKLMAYEMMMRHGLIEFEMIKRHSNRDSRIKYIESLPRWKGLYSTITQNII